MLDKSQKLSKSEKKRLLEEYDKLQNEKSKCKKQLESESYLSSCDFVYYMMKYKSKD